MNLFKVESEQKLQHLVTHIILIEKEHFTMSTITEKVMNHEFFNNFCDEKHVNEMVTDTIQTFMRHGQVNTYDHTYYVVR